MHHLLERSTSHHLYVQTQNRRHIFERRQSLPSFSDIYHWYSAITLKISGVILIAMLTAWWQKPTHTHEYSVGVVGPAAVYKWVGYHRMERQTSQLNSSG